MDSNISNERRSEPAQAGSLDAVVRQRWPNNKPMLTTEEELYKRGMAVECREPVTLQGYTPVWCMNIFGVHEFHMLSND